MASGTSPLEQTRSSSNRIGNMITKASMCVDGDVFQDIFWREQMKPSMSLCPTSQEFSRVERYSCRLYISQKISYMFVERCAWLKPISKAFSRWATETPGSTLVLSPFAFKSMTSSVSKLRKGSRAQKRNLSKYVDIRNQLKRNWKETMVVTLLAHNFTHDC